MGKARSKKDNERFNEMQKEIEETISHLKKIPKHNSEICECGAPLHRLYRNLFLCNNNNCKRITKL